jgi:hypothetical protein
MDLERSSPQRVSQRRRPPPIYSRKRWEGSLGTLKRRLFIRSKRFEQRLAVVRGHVPDRRPVFLSGVHRSGTNMMMETLEWHPATDVFREADPRAFRHFQMQSEGVIDELIAGSSADRVVVKALHEADRLRFLLDVRPGAQAIWMFRDWRDVVNSIVARWPGHRNEIDELARGIDTGSWRSRGLTPKTRALLGAHYRPDLDEASVNTLFWLIRNELLFEQQLQADERVVLVNYETLLLEPRPQLEALCRFLELPSCARMFAVASADKVRKKPPPAVAPDVAQMADAMLDRLSAAWRSGAAADSRGERSGSSTAEQPS